MRILLFLFFPLCALAQNEPSYNTALISSELLKNADAVVRSQEITFSVSAADEAVFREKRVVTLFNDKSDYDKLTLFYNSFNKIGRIKGSLYDAAGNFLRDVEKNEIEDYSAIHGFSIYEDSRVRYLNVSHDRYPYTVVFDYEIKYRDLLFSYDDWSIQYFKTSVEQASLTVIMPEEIKLYHKSLNIKLEPSITSDKGKRRYEWKVEKLPAIEPEPYAPSAYELLPQVLLSPETFKADGYTGSMASWKDFGQFRYELWKGRDELSPTLKKKVRELTAGKNDSQKVAALYRYLQENTRYVSIQLGIGGWQPFDAQYVEKNKYGDCKALSNFMKALLKEAGITSYPAVVMAGETFRDLSEDFVTNAFNHIILYVPLQDIWLECTSNKFPPNYLGDFTAGRKVLLVTEQGGKLARTPAFAPDENSATRHTEINVTASGGAKIIKKSTLYGPAHEPYRDMKDQLSPDEMKQKMQEETPLSQANFTHLDIQAEKETPTVHVEYALDVPQFGSKSGKRLFLPVNPINAFIDVPPANDKRIHPVEITLGYVEHDTIILNFPEGYSVESIPAENTTLNTEFGSYSSQIIRQEKALVLVRRLEMKPIRLPAERYGEWRNFCRDVAKADAMKIVLVNKT